MPTVLLSRYYKDKARNDASIGKLDEAKQATEDLINLLSANNGESEIDYATAQQAFAALVKNGIFMDEPIADSLINIFGWLMYRGDEKLAKILTDNITPETPLYFVGKSYWNHNTGDDASFKHMPNRLDLLGNLRAAALWKDIPMRRSTEIRELLAAAIENLPLFNERGKVALVR